MNIISDPLRIIERLTEINSISASMKVERRELINKLNEMGLAIFDERNHTQQMEVGMTVICINPNSCLSIDCEYVVNAVDQDDNTIYIIDDDADPCWITTNRFKIKEE